MNKIFLFVAVLSLSSFCAYAQKSAKVVLIEDELISVLQQKRIEFADNNESEVVRRPGTKGTTLGFRVQIYTGTSRNGAYAAQSQFQRLHPDVNTYVSYTQPNYRVKVGDFRTRSEAQAMMRALNKDYNVFLFTEQVNVVY